MNIWRTRLHVTDLAAAFAAARDGRPVIDEPNASLPAVADHTLPGAPPLPAPNTIAGGAAA